MFDLKCLKTLKSTAELSLDVDASLLVVRLLVFGFVEAIGLRLAFGHKPIARFVHLFPDSCDFVIELLLCNVTRSDRLEEFRLQMRDFCGLVETISYFLPESVELLDLFFVLDT
ncbi:unnamed protein product [Peronospora destructor]|uniref:Uncharacterized protein n=1 Tax=Peronospora destructor TaxID=86335 RepID=A0AAV0T0U3_9STRA|nr:unnamed protein product [Peronospora destructor]